MVGTSYTYSREFDVIVGYFAAYDCESFFIRNRIEVNKQHRDLTRKSICVCVCVSGFLSVSSNEAWRSTLLIQFVGDFFLCFPRAHTIPQPLPHTYTQCHRHKPLLIDFDVWSVTLRLPFELCTLYSHPWPWQVTSANSHSSHCQTLE